MDRAFWDKKWSDKETRWDIGYVSTPLKSYFDQLEDKNIRILIPGAGNSYEAEYLHKIGFSNVFVVEISALAIESFQERYPDFPLAHVLNKDFFELYGQYDLIVEQTFFCALHPEMREKYCQKMKELLKPEGKLIGVLFDFPLESGPPFGGTLEEYEERFKRYFSSVKIERCINSIEPRRGGEYWFSVQV